MEVNFVKKKVELSKSFVCGSLRGQAPSIAMTTFTPW